MHENGTNSFSFTDKRNRRVTKNRNQMFNVYRNGWVRTSQSDVLVLYVFVNHMLYDYITIRKAFIHFEQHKRIRVRSTRLYRNFYITNNDTNEPKMRNLRNLIR